MEYKLFDEFITLQALLKEVGIIQSGGAIKSFLADHQVFFKKIDEEKNLELGMSSLSQISNWRSSSLPQVRRKFLNIKRNKQRKKEWQTWLKL